MVILLWDASGLAKRYAPEVGSDVVDALFVAVPLAQCVSSVVSYVEVCSILLRKVNRGTLNRSAYTEAKSALHTEMIDHSDFNLLSLDDDAFYDGIAFMEAHNINATDAALLVAFIAYIQASGPHHDATFVLVASDARLLRAAQAEGIRTINPETFSADAIPALLVSL